MINYRPDDTLAGQQGIEDVRAAVQLLRDQAAELDGTRLALVGFSAGGPSLATPPPTRPTSRSGRWPVPTRC